MSNASHISFETLVEIVMAARKLGKRRLELEMRRRIKDEYRIILAFPSKPRVDSRALSQYVLAVLDVLDQEKLIGVCYVTWRFRLGSLTDIRWYLEFKHGIRITFMRESRSTCGPVRT